MEKSKHFNLLKRYLDNACTNSFILGFIDCNGNVKASLIENMTADQMQAVTVHEKPTGSGSHATDSVRYRPNRKQALYIEQVATQTWTIASLQEFETMNKEGYNNRGYLLEQLLYKQGIIDLDLNPTDFRLSPDGYYKGLPVQVKFGGRYNGSNAPRVNTAATVITESELQGMNI